MDGDLVHFEDLKDPDMGEPLGCACTENQGNFGGPGGRRWRRGRGLNFPVSTRGSYEQG